VAASTWLERAERALAGQIADGPLAQVAERIGASPRSREGMEEAARRAVDGMGRHIDPGILELVVALNLAGFPTLSSCEGHLRQLSRYPWVEVGDRLREDATPDARRLIRAHNDRSIRRLIGVAESFGASREAHPWLRIGIIGTGSSIQGGGVLGPIGSLTISALGHDRRERLLSAAQAELREFAGFLLAHGRAMGEAP
jgi:hypothetical protein